MAAPSGPPAGYGSAPPTAPPVDSGTGRTAVRVGLVLTIGGLVLTILGFVMAVVSVAGALRGPSLVVPGTTTVHLDPGTKAIYEETFSFSGITPSDVTITGPKGDVRVRAVGGSQTITVNGTSYRARAEFDVDKSGDYRIEITGVPPTEVILGDLVTDTFKRAAPWLILGFVAGIAMVVGFIVLIVGLVRRSRAKRPPTPPRYGYGGPGGYPPGPGYPAPGYGAPPGYGPQPGYGAPPGYGPQPGYPPQPGSGWGGPATGAPSSPGPTWGGPPAPAAPPGGSTPPAEPGPASPGFAPPGDQGAGPTPPG